MPHPAEELSCHSVSLSSFQPLHFLSEASVTRVIVSSDLERTTGNGMQHFGNIIIMYLDTYTTKQEPNLAFAHKCNQLQFRHGCFTTIQLIISFAIVTIILNTFLSLQ